MLIDGAAYRIEYLHLSATDRCEQRCSCCISEGSKDDEQPAHWLTSEEIERLITVFAHPSPMYVCRAGGDPPTRLVEGFQVCTEDCSVTGDLDISSALAAQVSRSLAHDVRGVPFPSAAIFTDVGPPEALAALTRP